MRGHPGGHRQEAQGFSQAERGGSLQGAVGEGWPGPGVQRLRGGRVWEDPARNLRLGCLSRASLETQPGWRPFSDPHAGLACAGARGHEAPGSTLTRGSTGEMLRATRSCLSRTLTSGDRTPCGSWPCVPVSGGSRLCPFPRKHRGRGGDPSQRASQVTNGYSQASPCAQKGAQGKGRPPQDPQHRSVGTGRGPVRAETRPLLTPTSVAWPPVWGSPPFTPRACSLASCIRSQGLVWCHLWCPGGSPVPWGHVPSEGPLGTALCVSRWGHTNSPLSSPTLSDGVALQS